MAAVNLSDAKAQLSNLVERAERGEDVTILRRGRPAVRLVPIEQPRKPLDVEALRQLTAKMTPSKLTGVEIVREMRDSRY
ncbi:MAG TPA: type II toxin-antitoxin system prevent-host-death family antitoxin [Allosphingosinicella sp.]|jgi:prevent-host-death family protein